MRMTLKRRIKMAKDYRAWYESDAEHEYGYYSTRAFRVDFKKRMKLIAFRRGVPAEQVLSEAVEIGLNALENKWRTIL
jgi:hypothetical protein